MEIRVLNTEQEFIAAYPVVKELCTHLSLDNYLSILAKMREGGYELHALYSDEGNIVTVAGVAIRYDFFNGKHLWIYDMVTESTYRRKGFGKRLMTYLEDYARREGCQRTVLYSGLQRGGAHRFWESHMDYEQRGVVFKKFL